MDPSISHRRVFELRKSEYPEGQLLAKEASELLTEALGRIRHNLRYACDPAKFASWSQSEENCVSAISATGFEVAHVLNLGKMTELENQVRIPVWFSGDEVLFLHKGGWFFIGWTCPYGPEHYHCHGTSSTPFPMWERCKFGKVVEALEQAYARVEAKREQFLSDIRAGREMFARLRRALNGEEDALC